jgi:hypothetical protein
MVACVCELGKERECRSLLPRGDGVEVFCVIELQVLGQGRS